MQRLLTRALILAAAMLITVVSLEAQNTAGSPEPAIAVSMSLQKDKIPVGESPWANLRVENLTDREITINPLDPQIHVAGEKGELPRKPQTEIITERLQTRAPRLRRVVYVPWTIPPGESSIHRVQLAYYFDLTREGQYTVYMEVTDPSSHKSLRTNSAKFEMQPAKH